MLCPQQVSRIHPKVLPGVVQELVVTDTGVTPVVTGKDPAKIVVGKRQNVCLMAKITGTQAGVVLLQRYTEERREQRGGVVLNACFF